VIKKFNERLKKSVSGISDDALASLESHPWPGNIRELENVLQRAIILSPTTTLVMSDAWVPGLPVAASTNGADVTLVEIERRHICGILESVGWRIEGGGGAAKVLGLKPSTLRSRMMKLGIARPH
jgi:DNA-binding NtrC family response regulator